MTSAADIQRLLDAHMRRLQKLREQQAQLGISADPQITIEIEDIEATIDGLQKTLAEVGGAPATPAVHAQGASTTWPPSQQNQGVIVTGGTLNANQLAVGPGSRAIQVTHMGGSDVHAQARQRVDHSAIELLRALEQRSATVEDSADVARAIRQVVEEAKRPRPSKLALKSLLSGIEGAVGSQADLAPKLLELQSAVQELLGLG